jgi:hypothetical protein
LAPDFAARDPVSFRAPTPRSPLGGIPLPSIRVLGGPSPFSSADIPEEPSCSEVQVQKMQRWLRSGLERLKSGNGYSWTFHIVTTPCLMMLRGRLVTWSDMDLRGVLDDYVKSFKLRAHETFVHQAPRFRVRCQRPCSEAPACTKRCSRAVRTVNIVQHTGKRSTLRMKAYNAKRGKTRLTVPGGWASGTRDHERGAHAPRGSEMIDGTLVVVLTIDTLSRTSRPHQFHHVPGPQTQVARYNRGNFRTRRMFVSI